MFSIGFLDSGIGGLNVLNACDKKNKNLNLIYLGDNDNAPYGNKSIDFLKERVNYAFKIFKGLKVNCVVVACNTLSVSLGDYIKNSFDLDVILTLPIKPTNYKTPFLLSTPLTASSDFVNKFYSKKEVLPLPYLAKEIEDNVFNLKKINVVNELKKIPKNADCIVLGCTHYIYLKSYIEKITKLPVLSSSEVVSNTLVSKLSKIQTPNENYPYYKTPKNRILFIGENASYNERVYKSFF